MARRLDAHARLVKRESRAAAQPSGSASSARSASGSGGVDHAAGQVAREAGAGENGEVLVAPCGALRVRPEGAEAAAAREVDRRRSLGMRRLGLQRVQGPGDASGIDALVAQRGLDRGGGATAGDEAARAALREARVVEQAESSELVEDAPRGLMRRLGAGLGEHAAPDGHRDAAFEDARDGRARRGVARQILDRRALQRCGIERGRRDRVVGPGHVRRVVIVHGRHAGTGAGHHASRRAHQDARVAVMVPRRRPAWRGCSMRP